MNAFKDNITSADFWLRLVYTLLFALAWQVVEFLLAVILVLQIGFRLFTGQPHARLAGLGNSLSQYAWQMGRYVTGASEVKPWPFIEWPAEDAEWQPKPAEGPVTVDPHTTPVPPVTPVPPATSAPLVDPAQPAVVADVPPATEPEPPTAALPADEPQPEPPIVQPSAIDDPDATAGDGSRLKP
ncbi:DUF4389 domain-containing protein [Pseudomonas sp. MYb185]|uniref:DUF4389 domain-containing protein n=1 Tax=Pseudomonas sp. MYb185 TaxID=1848729 RepID=UPI000CFC07E0|nr:DUF4389 domain-containing protein [Pseudomonas sp. MYb185]PRB82122.1 hypothetical protein CQ007_08155 [Pseudomonas sp. MYb185]